MSYWELEEESWENEDNWDGANWMHDRGRKELLEQNFMLECESVECD